jgi:hypothetical protein
MTPLERRYRRLLRVLPAWYRASREEEMVDTFLSERADRPNADLDLEHGSPGWAEVRATVGLAVRSRFASARPAGDVVRLVAVLGLLAQFVVAMPDAVWIVRARTSMGDGNLAFALASDALTMAPIVLLLTGHRRVARVAVVLSVVQSLLFAFNWMPVTFAVNLPFWLAAGCMLVGFHREAPLPRAAPWWWVMLAGSGLAAVWLMLPWEITASMWPTVWMLLAGGTVWLILARTQVVALALAVFAVSFVPGQLMMLLYPFPPPPVELMALGVFVVACAAVGLRRVSGVRGASTA